MNLADDPEILGQFSTEEMTGRFLDLTAQHQAFINLKNAKAVSYDVYLSIFLDFADVPANVKTKKYRDYLQLLLEYLVSLPPSPPQPKPVPRNLAGAHRHSAHT